ncbi:MAG: flagellar motor switch protein FliG [Gammaproteobacteria bacterium]|nr:MAG: flagellar motor switch protein FliG [Gammaproteobacteria bacterium]
MAEGGAGESAPKGVERAAILLMALGEERAAEVLKHLGPREVQKVGTAMATLSDVTTEQVRQAVDAFVETVQEQTALGIGREEYVRKVLVAALGEEKAKALLDRIVTGTSSKGLEALKWMDARAIAELIRQEHPQIIAIVLSFLEPDQAADVLGLLNERLRADVLMRIATLEGIQPHALQELDEILEQQFSGSDTVKSSTVGGPKTAADILNFLDAATGQAVMELIKETDSDLGQKIEDLMFVFDNLAELDDRSMQALLREVSSDSLVLALKGADDAVKEKVFRNMSKRAAEMLREDLEARGPVKLSDVEAAQKEILAVARRMAEAGEINLGGGGEEYV